MSDRRDHDPRLAPDAACGKVLRNKYAQTGKNYVKHQIEPEQFKPGFSRNASGGLVFNPGVATPAKPQGRGKASWLIPGLHGRDVKVVSMTPGKHYSSQAWRDEVTAAIGHTLKLADSCGQATTTAYAHVFDPANKIQSGAKFWVWEGDLELVPLAPPIQTTPIAHAHTLASFKPGMRVRVVDAVDAAKYAKAYLWDNNKKPKLLGKTGKIIRAVAAYGTLDVEMERSVGNGLGGTCWKWYPEDLEILP